MLCFTYTKTIIGNTTIIIPGCTHNPNVKIKIAMRRRQSFGDFISSGRTGNKNGKPLTKPRGKAQSKSYSAGIHTQNPNHIIVCNLKSLYHKIHAEITVKDHEIKCVASAIA